MQAYLPDNLVRLPVNVARKAIKIREDTVTINAVIIEHDKNW
jgi:hypothetical protein